MEIMRVYNSFRAFLIRIILVSLLTTICAASAFGIWIDPYLKKVNTKDVKSIKVIEYSFGNGNWKEVDVMTAEYNNSGNLIKETRHTADGIFQLDYSYSYDEKGKMIKATGRRMRKEKIVPYEYFYKYDQKGNQIESIGYGTDGSVISRYTARYDENDNYIEGISYQDGVAVSKYDAEYDERNNLIKESKYKVYRYKGSEHYQLEYKHLYSYDNENNLVTEKNYENDEAPEYTYCYQYDAGNNLVKGVSYAEDDSVISRYFAEYDENNNLVKSINYGPKGEITSKHIAKYDKNNNLIEEMDCTESSTKIIYLAQYDEAGNLLEETHYSANMIGGNGLDYRYRYRYDSSNNRIEEIYYVFFQEKNHWGPISKQVTEICYQQ